MSTNVVFKMDSFWWAQFMAHFSSIYSYEILISPDSGPDATGVLSQFGLAVRRSAGQHGRFLSQRCRFDSHGGYIFISLMTRNKSMVTYTWLTHHTWLLSAHAWLFFKNWNLFYKSSVQLPSPSRGPKISKIFVQNIKLAFEIVFVGF